MCGRVILDASLSGTRSSTPTIHVLGRHSFTVLWKTLELQLEVVKRSQRLPSTNARGVERSTYCESRQTAVQVQDFPRVRTKRSLDNSCMHGHAGRVERSTNFHTTSMVRDTNRKQILRG